MSAFSGLQSETLATTASRLVLASASPRRAELLRQIGVFFDVHPVDLDETPFPSEMPEEYVTRLALAKAQACHAALADPQKIVLGSDTTVVCSGHILGKPQNLEEALSILGLLSGKTHQVMTAVAVVTAERHKIKVVTTDVIFRSISQAEIKHYWQTGEPCDKAGSYGIQGLGAVFVKELRGSYSAVVGLPLMETAELLNEMGIHVWQVS